MPSCTLGLEWWRESVKAVMTAYSIIVAVMKSNLMTMTSENDGIDYDMIRGVKREAFIPIYPPLHCYSSIVCVCVYYWQYCVCVWNDVWEDQWPLLLLPDARTHYCLFIVLCIIIVIDLVLIYYYYYYYYHWTLILLLLLLLLLYLWLLHCYCYTLPLLLLHCYCLLYTHCWWPVLLFILLYNWCDDYCCYSFTTWCHLCWWWWSCNPATMKDGASATTMAHGALVNWRSGPWRYRRGGKRKRRGAGIQR